MKRYIGRENVNRDLITIPALEKSFLYACGGQKGLVICIDLRLDEELAPDRLTDAVRRALSLKPHFRYVPAVRENRLYFRSQTGEPTLLPGVDRTVELGGEECQGFLFAVFQDGERLSFRVHHALTDIRGWIDFVRAALAFYYVDEPVCAMDGSFVPLAERHIDQSIPFGKYRPGRFPVFVPPEERFGMEEDQCRAFLLRLPFSGLFAKAKNMETSPAALFAALISEAFCRVYDTDERIVAVNTAVDTRRFFGERSQNNASLGGWIPYHPALRRMDAERRPSLLRARLELELQRENLVEELRGVAALSEMIDKALDNMPLPELLRSIRDAQERNNREHRFPLTYQLAYAGHVAFTPTAEAHVKQIVVSYPAYENQCNFDIVEYDGEITISYLQNFEGSGMIHALSDLLREQFPETVLEDLGKRRFDSFNLSRFL